MWGLQDGPPYVGANTPSSGSYIGQLIQVDNPAVPGGRSILRWTGMIWAPPAGEMIAAATPSTLSPIALVTPGTTSLTKIWASPVIPDYMLPEFLEFEVSGNIGLANASGGVSGAFVGICVNGTLPTSVATGSYAIAAQALTPQPPPSYTGVGHQVGPRRGLQAVRGGAFKSPGVSVGTSYDMVSSGSFVSGNNRLYAMAKPSGVTDEVRFDGAQVWSKGNL